MHGVRLRPVSGMRGEGGGVAPKGAGASGALVIVLEASGCAKSLLGALHLTTFRGSGIQFLVILCFPGIKEVSEKMDREFATKVTRKDGRKGDLAVAWEVEVLAVIDTRGAREKPLSDGLWDVQPKSLSPDLAILGNVIFLPCSASSESSSAQ